MRYIANGSTPNPHTLSTPHTGMKYDCVCVYVHVSQFEVGIRLDQQYTPRQGYMPMPALLV